jgi:hypothetical protein
MRYESGHLNLAKSGHYNLAATILKVDNLCYVKSNTNTPNPLPNATAQQLPASVPMQQAIDVTVLRAALKPTDSLNAETLRGFF